MLSIWTYSLLKPPILNGSRGLSIKGPGPGEASYHYSLASLKTTGKLKWRGTAHKVSGASFMDREFGTSILPRSIRGWDWFGIILDNNHEVMASIIRKSDGTMAETSSATMVFPDGAWQCVEAVDLQIEAVDFWTSQVTGARNPIHWFIKIKSLNLELQIVPLIKEHELVSVTSTTINYWEGPVNVSGTISGQNVKGHGHVELVGYAESAGENFDSRFNGPYGVCHKCI